MRTIWVVAIALASAVVVGTAAFIYGKKQGESKK
jgi:hypothetical protein